MELSQRLQEKLAELPKQPGVYFHKDSKGEIIYVGKAARLSSRVRQYFQSSRGRDPKTEALVREIADIDWMVVDSELEALFLEAEMIRRYMPRFNILLRDDKAMSYIRIDYDSDYPTVSTTRRPLDDGARYYGPYSSTTSIRQALKMLRRVFPFATRRIPGQKRASLHYHLGLDPGLEEGRTTLEEYRANLRKLMAVIEGKRKSIEKDLEKEMRRAAKAKEFERAALLRNQLLNLLSINEQVIFSDKEFMDLSKDHALDEIVNLLSIPKFPRRIEGYDISHQQGTDVVASMVVFTNGVSNKSEYRKFKTKINHNNDFYNMNETLKRRLSEKNIKAWGKPDLVLIDGGKGQLDAAIKARDEISVLQGSALQSIPFIGLAKREEQIVIKKQEARSKNQVGVTQVRHPESVSGSPGDATGPRNKFGMTQGGSNVELNESLLNKLGGFASESDDFILVNIPHNTNLVKLLQRIRDESHRFAVTYHSVLKTKRQTSSLLEEIPGIGPATRKKLLRTFGSMRGVSQASEAELATAIGASKASIVKRYISTGELV